MLKRIKDSFAAHGVLAIFLLLLSVSHGIPVVEIQEELTTEQTIETTAATEGSNSTNLRVRDLPFKYLLQNPCRSSPADSTPAASAPQGSMSEAERRQHYLAFSRLSSGYLQDAQEMLQQNIVPECNNLGTIPPLQNTPTVEELKAMNSSDALQSLYFSLLRHTAYAFFIHFQHQNSTLCPNNETVVSSWTELMHKQKLLACIFRMGNTNDFRDVTEEVLNESLSDLTMCARRHNRDCQVLKSIIHLMGVVNAYSSYVAQSLAGR